MHGGCYWAAKVTDISLDIIVSALNSTNFSV